MARRAGRCLALAALLALALPASAHATAGDLYAAGTAYQASTYAGHRSAFGGSEQWVVDINANEGDAGRPIYAPEAGSVAVFSTGWGDGYGNSIIWTSADGREQIHIAHLSAFAATGPVAGGTLIGYAGSTGNSSGDHMHVSRAYDGQPAPVVLSGHGIEPGYSGNGNQYASAGWLSVALSVSGVIEGMPYYRPVTLTFECAGADAGTFSATLDGVPITSGSVISAPGSHTLAMRASLNGCAYVRSVSFSVETPPAQGLEPVFRFYKPTGSTHFFTSSHDERDSVVTRWSGAYRYEGVAYWVNPASNAQPLYRFYNRANGSHFYTASLDEANTILLTWGNVYTLDGQTYAVSPTPVPNGIPVYRFYNLRNGSHFYTSSAQERDTVIAQWSNVYRYEGEAFWIGQ